MFGVTLITLITGKAAIRNGQNHFINNVLCRHYLVVRFGAQTKIDNFCYVAKIENPLTKTINFQGHILKIDTFYIHRRMFYNLTYVTIKLKIIN